MSETTPIRSNLHWFLATLALVMLVPRSDTRAATFVVDPSGGGDYLAISAAIIASSAGDTVRVLPGLYREDISLSHSLVLVSTGGSSLTTIEGQTTSLGAVTITSDRVRLVGFTVRGGLFGLDVAGAVTMLAIDGCRIENSISFHLRIPPAVVAPCMSGLELVPHAGGARNTIQVLTGTLSTSATWPVPPAGFVYFADDPSGTSTYYPITIAGASGPVLTLQTGTIFKFRNDTGLSAGDGTLPGGVVANGVVFTSYRDDAVGGDSTGDGAVAPAAGDWRMIQLRAGTIGTFTSCTFRYGGLRDTGTVRSSAAAPTFAACQFTGGSDAGFYGEDGTPSITGSTFSDNENAVHLIAPTLAGSISGNSILPQTGVAAIVNPSCVVPFVSSNAFTARGDGRFNTIQVLTGTLSTSATWPVPPAGFVYFADDPSGTSTYYPITIAGASGPVLTLQTGTIFKFRNDTGLSAGDGTLPGGVVANGVVFTSYRDDAVGGDSTGDGAVAPVAGDWRKISLRDGGIGEFIDCRFRFGGLRDEGVSEWNEDVGSRLAFCSFENNRIGVFARANVRPHIVACCFEGNLQYGVYTEPPTDLFGSLPARDCWWGEASGPSGGGPGTGDPVSQHVLFDHWTTYPRCGDYPVQVLEPELPSRFEVFPPFPNPFNPATTIAFTLPRAERVKLAIFDLFGRQVRVLVDEVRVAGSYRVQWNGMSERGQQMASGVYVCRMDADSFHESKRMTLVK